MVGFEKLPESLHAVDVFYLTIDTCVKFLHDNVSWVSFSFGKSNVKNHFRDDQFIHSGSVFFRCFLGKPDFHGDEEITVPAEAVNLKMLGFRHF